MAATIPPRQPPLRRGEGATLRPRACGRCVGRGVARPLRAAQRLLQQDDFGSLGLFVADDVRVDDKPTGVAAYVAGLEEVVRVFPDYRWEVRHLLVEPPLLATHLVDSGTHRGTFLGVPSTGRGIRTQSSRSTEWQAAASPTYG
jgi:predicted ester cyclase